MPQLVNRRIPVDQFAALCLGKACLDMRGDGFALIEHPIFKIELLADDLKSLIENLAGIPIRAGTDRQVNDPLLFGFEVNGLGYSLSKGIFLPYDPHPPLLPAST